MSDSEMSYWNSSVNTDSRICELKVMGTAGMGFQTRGSRQLSRWSDSHKLDVSKRRTRNSPWIGLSTVEVVGDGGERCRGGVGKGASVTAGAFGAGNHLPSLSAGMGSDLPKVTR